MRCLVPTDNKKYNFGKWAGKEYREYSVNPRVGGECTLFSEITADGVESGSFSGRQCDIKLLKEGTLRAQLLKESAQRPSTAVVMRTTGSTIPTSIIARWAKQVQGIAELWVFVDTTSPQDMSALDERCPDKEKCKSKLEAAKRETSGIDNLQFWVYDGSLFGKRWGMGGADKVMRLTF